MMKIIGHRGARGLAPENTLAGFQKALEHGVDEIAVDVRVTKDGVAVLLHDTVARSPGGETLLAATSSYDELKAFKPDIVTLTEALEWLNESVPLLIEVKPKVPTAPVVKVLKAYLNAGKPPASFLLGSFSQKTLRALHSELPEVEKVVIERWSGVKARIRARQVHTKRLSMKQRWLWSGFLLGMSRAGYKIAGYTMNDPAKARRWSKYGLYGVITDFPDRFEQ